MYNIMKTTFLMQLHAKNIYACKNCGDAYAYASTLFEDNMR
jgi:hypothetical protein